MNSITEKQERCIHALHRQLHRTAPTQDFSTWSRQQASHYIDELKRELDPGTFAPATSTTQPVFERTTVVSDQSRIRLGLASKLVFGRWNGDPLQTENVEAFKERAKRLYDILLELEQEVFGGEGR